MLASAPEAFGISITEAERFGEPAREEDFQHRGQALGRVLGHLGLRTYVFTMIEGGANRVTFRGEVVEVDMPLIRVFSDLQHRIINTSSAWFVSAEIRSIWSALLSSMRLDD